jgi:hypothetical protein
MRYERVKIKRDTNTVHNREAPEWEIPVLEFIFEDGNVERTGVYLTDDKEYPDAVREFDRMTKAYGADVQTNVPHVASVYGNARAGVRALDKAIEAAKLEDEDAAEEVEVAPTPKPAPRATKGRKTAVVDSLLS